MDPLMPHLMDLLARPESERLILAGGFGIRVKQAYLANTGVRTLIPEVPPARATLDLDFFLRMEMFTTRRASGEALRAALDELGYKPKYADWQFEKPIETVGADRKVVIDLLARLPVEGENVRIKSPRVGSGANVGLHGHETPEAFAVEIQPVRIPIEGVTSSGGRIEAMVAVAHPYAMITMKVRAAYDWLRRTRGLLEANEFCDKHAVDVYVLVAMLTDALFREATEIRRGFDGLTIASEIRREATELFGTPSSPGFLKARRQGGVGLDHASFWEGLREVLGGA